GRAGWGPRFAVGAAFGENAPRRIAVVLGATHPADPAVGQQLDVERARGRAVVRADRMTDADFGVDGHEGAFPAICTTLPEFGALAKGSDLVRPLASTPAII